ncbi:MAG TPA: hypothetical protein VGY54_20515 [Polyangiaceae bacterium]|nr:hypothetical protein [Polyangiaceae bacterium]
MGLCKVGDRSIWNSTGDSIEIQLGRNCAVVVAADVEIVIAFVRGRARHDGVDHCLDAVVARNESATRLGKNRLSGLLGQRTASCVPILR